MGIVFDFSYVSSVFAFSYLTFRLSSPLNIMGSSDIKRCNTAPVTTDGGNENSNSVDSVLFRKNCATEQKRKVR